MKRIRTSLGGLVAAAIVTCGPGIALAQAPMMNIGQEVGATLGSNPVVLVAENGKRHDRGRNRNNNRNRNDARNSTAVTSTNNNDNCVGLCIEADVGEVNIILGPIDTGIGATGAEGVL